MQTFTTTLNFFKEKDDLITPLQNMSTKLVNRQKSLDKPNDDHQSQQACISKRLYEDHVSK